MRTLNTDIIEKIVLISERIKKIWENSIFWKEKLTILQFNILWAILSDNAKTINDIKKKLVISSASMSQTINRMEKNELIERLYWVWDRREVNISITKKWEKIFKLLDKEYIKIADEYFWRIPEEDKKLIISQLKNIEKVIDEI